MKTIVIRDKARDSLARIGKGLSALWRRDAEAIRAKALRAEHRAADALRHNFMRVKPKVVRMEHLMHDGLVTALRRVRLHS